MWKCEYLKQQQELCWAKNRFLVACKQSQRHRNVENSWNKHRDENQSLAKLDVNVLAKATCKVFLSSMRKGRKLERNVVIKARIQTRKLHHREDEKGSWNISENFFLSQRHHFYFPLLFDKQENAKIGQHNDARANCRCTTTKCLHKKDMKLNGLCFH